MNPGCKRPAHRGREVVPCRQRMIRCRSETDVGRPDAGRLGSEKGRGGGLTITSRPRRIGGRRKRKVGTSMSPQTVTLLGRQFVLIPKREFDRMRAKLEQQARQDRGDIAEAKRRAREPSIPLKEVRKRLGL